MSVILLDCDGPLSDFIGGIARVVNAEYGTAHKAEDCKLWDIADAFGLDWDVFSGIAQREGFCLSLEPSNAAQRAVSEMRRIHEVFVVTSPWIGRHWMPERTEWLQRHFGFDRKHVIHAYTKRLVHGDVLVDDKPETIVEWAKQWPDSRAFLWSMPHNKQAGDLPWNAERVGAWDDILAAVGPWERL